MTKMGPPLSFADAAQMAFAAILLVFAPAVALMLLDSALPLHQHTGFFGRALWSAPATLACALVLWPPAWLLCRRPNARALAVMFALIYTPVNAYNLVGYLNVAYDAAPGRQVTVRFVRRDVRSKGPSQDLLTSWEDPQDTVELTAELPARVAIPGAPVSLTVHPGRLHLEWVSDVRAQQAADRP